MDELPDVPALRVLEPPAGGLAALRDRLAAPRRRWGRLALPVLAAAAIALLVLARLPRDEVALPQQLLPDPSAGSTPFYWAASTPGRRHLPAAPKPAMVPIERAPAVAVVVLR